MKKFKMIEEVKRPRVGVGVIILIDNKVIMLKRKNSHGDGSWCFPGGHLEFFEDVEDCAIRETREEVGLEIENIKYLTITNDKFIEENKHYITIFVVGEYVSGDIEIMEEDKIEEVGLFEWDDLPSPLFLPIQNLLKFGLSPSNEWE